MVSLCEYCNQKNQNNTQQVPQAYSVHIYDDQGKYTNTNPWRHYGHV